MERRKRAPMRKKIYDWRELVDAYDNRPQVPSSEAADHVRGMLEKAPSRRQGSAYVQLTDRLVAHYLDDFIELLWALTPRGTAIDRTAFTRGVCVRPAAGGRTSYAVDNTVDGHFANKHLPLKASERAGGGRRTHRSTQWFCGRSGMYSRGMGPYYPDVGPDFMNDNLEQFESKIHEACEYGLPADWAASAASMCRRVAAAAAPFRDVIVRYEGWLPAESADDGEDDDDYPTRRFHLCAQRGGHNGAISSHGIRIRLKSPHSVQDGVVSTVPDFSVVVIGPDPYIEGSPGLAYGAELLHAAGRRSAVAYWDPHERNKHKLDLKRMLYMQPNEVLEAARQWAAARVFIPV